MPAPPQSLKTRSAFGSRTGRQTSLAALPPGAANVISGNNQNGVYLSGASVTQNSVQGNYIGTNAGGQNLGNGSAGILVSSSAANNLLGGAAADAGNTIAFNTGDGIWLNSDAGTGNAILGNSIYSNSGIGVDLLNDHVTANDAGDGDTGPNDLQNYPVLASAVSVGGNTTITGSLNSTAGVTFRIEFFSSPTSDATGYGEGQTYLGASTVTTDGSGNAAFSVTLTGVAVAVGHVVSATATVDLGGGSYGSTSEFAQNVTASTNSAPVADDDAYSTNEDTPLVVPADGVLLNDADPDGDSITAVLVSGPSHAASFTLNSDGSFSYTPTANWIGSDDFTYKANDGSIDSNIRETVTIAVDPVNDAPDPNRRKRQQPDGSGGLRFHFFGVRWRHLQPRWRRRQEWANPHLPDHDPA